MASIREWENAFVPVNRIPTDILSLIPTHLSSQKDRFRAASVCRHWRGALLKRGALWSQLFLKKGEEYVSTLLERAKGSELDIVTGHNAPLGTVALVSPHAQQIVYLEFVFNTWQDIIAFSESNSGQLPLLRTLKISPDGRYNQSIVVTPPSLPLFRGSVNLQKFVLHSWTHSSLSYFVLPNLTTFELMSLGSDKCNASCLLNFLEASPTLQMVEIRVGATFVLESIPQEMVVILPNVKTFSLHVRAVCGDVPQVYDIAAHISCPRAEYTSLMNEMYGVDMSAGQEASPTPALWNTIVHQYSANPVEEVTLDLKPSWRMQTNCFLTFQSSGETVVKLDFKVHEEGAGRDNSDRSVAEIGWETFSQALKTIRNHPLLSHVKRLHIKLDDSEPMYNTHEMPGVVGEVRKLFGSLGPLDKLTIDSCDLRVFLANFLDNPGPDRLEQPIVFPQIKQFTILHPMLMEQEHVEAIAELAKSQHSLGIPFERMIVRILSIPEGVAEKLEPWVGEADCSRWWEGEDL